MDLSDIRPADIIVTRAKTAGSSFIRIASCSTYSHAILVDYNNMCIEAIPSGVERVDLSSSLLKASYASVYRHRFINEDYAAWACHYANQQVGKSYDKLGAVRSGVDTGCGILIEYSAPGQIVSSVDDKKTQDEHDSSFFVAN